MVLALGVAGTAIRLLPVQENYVFETAAAPVQGKSLDELDDGLKAKIATGLVEDTRVKTARPKPALAAPPDREIVQDTRILTAKATPNTPGEPLTKFSDKVPPPTTARAADAKIKTDVALKAPPPIMEVQAPRGGGAVTGPPSPGPSPPPQGSTSAK